MMSELKLSVHDIVKKLKATGKVLINRMDITSPRRLFLHIDSKSVRACCKELFYSLGARYITSIGGDDTNNSQKYFIAHDFAFDKSNILCSIICWLDPDNAAIDSITPDIPAASWAEREFMDLMGIKAVGHNFPKRLILPDGWPDNAYPLRKDFSWDKTPMGFDENKKFDFEPVPEGCVVVPFGPLHPSLDEPTHFRLYVDGEIVRGCEYRGFMAHRGIEKLAESVLTYNEIPMVAERICGICGCVHNVAYAQAVEESASIPVPPRARYIRTIMLELERLHSHLLWTGLASHILGFDTLFMLCFRIREPIMRLAEKITGNRKTYGLCVIGGVRWDLTPELKEDLTNCLNKIESEWQEVVKAALADKNLQKRTRGVGVIEENSARTYSLVGPVARGSGINIDCRKDHPYAAYDEIDFDVIVDNGCDVWARVKVRLLEVFESIKIIRQCLNKLPNGPISNHIDYEIPPNRFGLSSVEAPRGESHHFLITGDLNRPNRWKVRAPTYQNLQGIPVMIKDQRIADMTISLGSIDPCFSCTDRVELIDIRSGKLSICSQEELTKFVKNNINSTQK
jgi:Ni,Fe-hydrogenase III large subunit/Ni,Fe-hydrogenase III component G